MDKMVEYLCNTFILKGKNRTEAEIRNKAGSMTILIGMVCNLFLFVLKFAIGLLSGSISVISDGFNNLSDCVSNILTLLGYKMAAKPADKDHPFGHGRIEYLTSLMLAIIILLVGFELLKSSVNKIFHPSLIEVSWIALICLLISILIKLAMYFFYKSMASYTQSTVLLTSAKDSINDAIATSSSLIAFIYTDFDGMIGCLVSCFVLYSGYQIIKDTLDDLIGKPVDEKMLQDIEEILLSDPMILRVHDIILHNYGPNKLLGSAHVEVDAKTDFLMAHDVADELEKRIQKKMNVGITLHMDPIVMDKKTEESRKEIELILKQLDEGLTLHDFRIQEKKDTKYFIFDIDIPYECMLSNEEIQTKLDEKLKAGYKTKITFDRSYL